MKMPCVRVYRPGGMSQLDQDCPTADHPFPRLQSRKHFHPTAICVSYIYFTLLEEFGCMLYVYEVESHLLDKGF